MTLPFKLSKENLKIYLTRLPFLSYDPLRDHVDNPIGSNPGHCTLHICCCCFALTGFPACYLLTCESTILWAFVSHCYKGLLSQIIVWKEDPFSPRRGIVSAYECRLLLLISTETKCPMETTQAFWHLHDVGMKLHCCHCYCYCIL